jgi:predicted dehydrogenase
MKALFVGLGGVGQRHLRNLRAVAGEAVELLAYRVRRLTHVVTDTLGIESGADLEKKYGLRVFGDLDEALCQRPDAVFICNPSSLHTEVALKAAEAKCHLFIEKPLASSWQDIDRLIALVEKNRLATLVGYQLRFHPVLRHLHALLQERAVGRVLAVRIEVGEWLPGWHPYEDYRQMYASRKDLGGGVVLSQIHEMDYVYWLFGRPRRVFALGGKLSSLEIDVEDVAAILLQCEREGQTVPVEMHLDYVQRPPSRTCTVIGDAGKIAVDLRAPSIELFNASGERADFRRIGDFQRNQLFLDEMAHFLACVRGEQKSVVTVRDGAESLRMALAVKESLANGNVVSLA